MVREMIASARWEKESSPSYLRYVPSDYVMWKRKQVSFVEMGWAGCILYKLFLPLVLREISRKGSPWTVVFISLKGIKITSER